MNKLGLIRHFDPTGDVNNFRREVRMDSSVIELFFSNEDSAYSDQNDVDLHQYEKKLDEINYIIQSMLPEIEKNVISLLFFYRKKQEVVGRILKISQEMVFYYKNRALKRIKLLFFFRHVDITKMEEFLEEHMTKKQKVAMIEYFKVHDLRKIAKTICKMEGKKNIFYEAIGSRIKLGLKRLKMLKDSTDPSVAKKAELYHKVFSYLKKYNSLYHTQSKKRGQTEIVG